MAKSTDNNTDKKNETKSTPEPAPLQQPAGQDIVQPDKNNPDSQDYIRQNARKGEPVPTPMGSETMRRGDNVELTGEEK